MGIYGGIVSLRIVCRCRSSKWDSIPIQALPSQAFLKFSETYPREDARELFAGTAR